MTLHHWLKQTPAGLRTALVRGMNLYPPFIGAGIRVIASAPDLSAFDVEMHLRPWNRNLKGTHFGGSIYAMCDPFFLFAVTAQLGPDYLVWDKSAQIDFRRPGRGTLHARFAVTPEQIAEIRQHVAAHGKHEPIFDAEVIGPAGEIVATVHKRLWVKKLSAAARPAQPEARHDQPTA